MIIDPVLPLRGSFASDIDSIAPHDGHAPSSSATATSTDFTSPSSTCRSRAPRDDGLRPGALCRGDDVRAVRSRFFGLGHDRLVRIVHIGSWSGASLGLGDLVIDLVEDFVELLELTLEVPEHAADRL